MKYNTHDYVDKEVIDTTYGNMSAAIVDVTSVRVHKDGETLPQGLLDLTHTSLQQYPSPRAIIRRGYLSRRGPVERIFCPFYGEEKVPQQRNRVPELTAALSDVKFDTALDRDAERLPPKECLTRRGMKEGTRKWTDPGRWRTHWSLRMYLSIKGCRGTEWGTWSKAFIARLNSERFGIEPAEHEGTSANSLSAIALGNTGVPRRSLFRLPHCHAHRQTEDAPSHRARSPPHSPADSHSAYSSAWASPLSTPTPKHSAAKTAPHNHHPRTPLPADSRFSSSPWRWRAVRNVEEGRGATGVTEPGDSDASSEKKTYQRRVKASGRPPDYQSEDPYMLGR
ncbi:hypothetical protein R3P38DRAFT_2799587 [Favolaschia claudopus]|uniref:Uncharacterized protein n=1 Tax=Favolaschia claudopus TaxID=2862362 RepID=A0AAW0A060_9AGAR